MTLAEQTETAWQTHYDVRSQLEALLVDAFARSPFGLAISQLHTLADAACDVIAQEAKLTGPLAKTWTAAMAAQARRDVAIAAGEDPEVVAPFLEKEGQTEEAIRGALREASAGDVAAWLAEITDADNRRQWARVLAGYAQEDGNRYDVVSLLVDAGGGTELAATVEDDPPETGGQTADAPADAPVGDGGDVTEPQ